MVLFLLILELARDDMVIRLHFIVTFKINKHVLVQGPIQLSVAIPVSDTINDGFDDPMFRVQLAADHDEKALQC